MFKSRRKLLKKEVLEKGMDGVLIDSPSNLYYYTGFTGGEAVFLLAVQPVQAVCGAFQKNESGGGAEGEWVEGCLITDSRYYEQVEKECPDIALVRLEKKGYGETVKNLLEEMCQKGFFAAGLGKPESNSEVKADIAVEDSMELARYLKLSKACQGYAFHAAGSAINKCRMVKDREELERLADAEAVGDAAFTHILDMLKPGITEREIALELEFFMKRRGAEKLSFDTIVASGPNSSMPHAQVTDRRIEKGDFVTMDFGCVYRGYCSDMTRTVAVGHPSEEMRRVYQIVLEANLRAMEGIRAGVSCREIDALARNHIAEQGYGDYFGHGLGHGVGLDIHEEPRFSPKCDIVTEENMVITDEPGIYLPGKFGVRIEDLIVVKKDGFVSLSHSPKELIVL